MRHEKHRLHAERLGYGEVARQVLEHDGLFGVDAIEAHELVVSRPGRLRHVVGCNDVEDVVEIVEDTESAGGRFRVLDAAVGEDELASRQRLDSGGELRLRRQRGIVDRMRLLQEIVGIDAVMDHQPLQGRAVLEVILLLQFAGVFSLHLQKSRDISRHILVDLREEINMMRIKRVVEIEHPIADVREI